MRWFIRLVVLEAIAVQKVSADRSNDVPERLEAQLGWVHPALGHEDINVAYQISGRALWPITRHIAIAGGLDVYCACIGHETTLDALWVMPEAGVRASLPLSDHVEITGGVLIGASRFHILGGDSLAGVAVVGELGPMYSFGSVAVGLRAFASGSKHQAYDANGGFPHPDGVFTGLSIVVALEL